MGGVGRLDGRDGGAAQPPSRGAVLWIVLYGLAYRQCPAADVKKS